MNEQFKIESDVPIPTRKSESRTPFGAALKKLNVGDSFEFGDKDVKRAGVHSSAKRMGFKVAIRCVDKPNCRFRIWRTT